MTRSRKLSSQAVDVPGALIYGEWLYGLELAERPSLKSGSLYPILIRLAERGFLESCWIEPTVRGRPPRHAYRILAEGRRALLASREATTLSGLRESRA